MNGNGKRPLSQFPGGARVRIEGADGCRRMRGRLCSLGITPGTELEVLSGGRGGPCRVRVHDSSLVIGRGMAGKIMASPCVAEQERGGKD